MPGIGRGVAPPVAGQRRTDDVERVGRIAAVGHRVGQRTDDVLELDDRSGPAVGEHQGHGVVDRRADVDEVDPDAVDGRSELGMAVEQGGPCRPVVAVGPVGAQGLDGAERYALGPVVDHFTGRPAGPSEAVAQVVQRVGVDRGGERGDLFGGDGGHRTRRVTLEVDGTGDAPWRRVHVFRRRRRGGGWVRILRRPTGFESGSRQCPARFDDRRLHDGHDTDTVRAHGCRAGHHDSARTGVRVAHRRDRSGRAGPHGRPVDASRLPGGLRRIGPAHDVVRGFRRRRPHR